MREKSSQGHSTSAVASDSTRQVPNFKESTSQSFDDDDNEWELGVGNLIIDLDADLERNSTSPISSQTSPKMSAVEHQATVDKGLKMKIKRKSGGAKSESKHEIVKNDQKMASIGEGNASGTAPGMDMKKQSPGDGKDKGLKGNRGIHKDKKSKDKPGKGQEPQTIANGFPLHSGNSNSSDFGNSLLESDKLPFGIKREPAQTPSLDPYEFNAKVEDRISIPVKKIKLEKNDAPSCPGASPSQTNNRTVNSFQNSADISMSSVSQPTHDAATETSNVGTITEPDCLGPCEPGTSVCLEGIVWQETENGVLVVNVTWRGKTYVGTLLDATKHDWAPPRFTCESPTSDFEARTPKGRGKRGARGSTSTPLNDMSNYTERKLRKGRRGTNNFQAPPSPAKSDITPVAGVKRKGRPAELDLSVNNEESTRSTKRNRSNSRSIPTSAAAKHQDTEPSVPPGTLIQCPEPNCNKKYRHINGLRYHQSHAHMNTSDDKEDSTKSTSSGDSRPTTPATPHVTAMNTDQSNGSKTPVKRTRDTESKSKSKSESNDKSKDSSKETSVKEEKKSEKPESNPSETSSEDDKKPPTSVASQVYQISGGAISRIGGVAVLPKPTFEISTSAVGVPVSVTTVTAVTVPIPSNPIVTHGAADNKDDKKKKADKSDKSKVGKPAVTRPIVPAPTPQTLTLTTNGPIPHSTLTAVPTHAQISPTLKPIQPKPTVMGEPSTVNPALVGLKEKKLKHKKKTKEKERSKSPKDLSPDAKDDSAIDNKDNVKAELKSVIKSLPLSVAEIGDGADSNKVKSEATPMLLIQEKDIKTEPGIDASRLQPPSSLNLNTRLEVSTPDPTDHGSESVQSPAYSDISDAADSAPSLDNEVDLKQKDKPTSGEGVTVDHNQDASLSAYGMYPYYGQAPYLIPAIPQTQAQTPSTAASPSTAVAAEQSSSKTQENKPSATVSKPPDRPDDVKDIVKKEPMANPAIGARDYRVQGQQQKLLSPSMYSQYQYLTAYGYIDPAYHMHLMASDPNYREKHEKFMEEQERMRKEQMIKQEKGTEKEKGNLTPKPSQVEQAKAEKTRPVNAVSPMVTADQNKNIQKLRDPKLSPRKDAKEKVEMTLKEKQNENLQILKENMELKPQMDNRAKPPAESYDPNMLLERQREELQRYYMYQQQKLIEQRHDDDGSGRRGQSSEGAKAEGKKPESKVHDQVKEAEKMSPRDSPVIKREPTMPSDLSTKKDSNSTERMKQFRDKNDERSRPTERPRTVDDKSRTRSPNVTPKLKTGDGSIPSVPVSSGSGNIVPTHYAQYLPAGYIQSPHAAFAQFPYDPSSMYRHGIIGYPPGPGYVHPAAAAQMRYQMSPLDLEKEKSAAIASPNMPNAPSPAGSGEQPKALDLLQQHASHYYSTHKIHELEKARPPSSPNPKPPSGSSSPSVPTSSYQKPREYRQSPPPQRHVHTHHHTHLVGGYPMPPYDPYSAIIASGSVAAASSISTEPLAPKQ